MLLWFGIDAYDLQGLLSCNYSAASALFAGCGQLHVSCFVGSVALLVVEFGLSALLLQPIRHG